ncbi:MAG: hypothetical protein ACM3WV_10085 [Bacillota bacterium]
MRKSAFLIAVLCLVISLAGFGDAKSPSVLVDRLEAGEVTLVSSEVMPYKFIYEKGKSEIQYTSLPGDLPSKAVVADPSEFTVEKGWPEDLNPVGGLQAPGNGIITIARKDYTVAWGRVASDDPAYPEKLFLGIDVNQDGAVEGAETTTSPVLTTNGWIWYPARKSVSIPCGNDFIYVTVTVIDARDTTSKGWVEVKNTFNGEVNTPKGPIRICIMDGNQDGIFNKAKNDLLFVDLDGDKKFDETTECFPLPKEIDNKKFKMTFSLDGPFPTKLTITKEAMGK